MCVIIQNRLESLLCPVKTPAYTANLSFSTDETHLNPLFRPCFTQKSIKKTCRHTNKLLPYI